MAQDVRRRRRSPNALLATWRGSTPCYWPDRGTAARSEGGLRLLVAYAILTLAYPFALNVALERGFEAEGLLLAGGLAALLAWVAFSILTRHADEVVLALLAGSALIVVDFWEAAMHWHAVEFTLPLAIGLALFNGLLRADTRTPRVARTARLPGSF